jgi:tRNA-Thr(GGU) m(6)t(6)A37 methyltransferase TsaA
MYLKPIGLLQSCFKQKFGTPRQPGIVSHSVAEILIDPQWQPELSLQGLEQFSHLWVIFEFHQNGVYEFHAKIHPPRLKGESMGLFATRSPHRPNPLGLSVVKILKVFQDRVLVSGVDIIDGTPVFDIKPYIPQFESIPHAKAQWVEQNPEQQIVVRWADGLIGQLTNYCAHSKEIQKYQLSAESLKELIEEVVSQDPRPLVYRGYEGQDSPYRKTHFFRLFDLDIEFQFDEVHIATVLQVQFFRRD